MTGRQAAIIALKRADELGKLDTVLDTLYVEGRLGNLAQMLGRSGRGTKGELVRLIKTELRK